MISRYGSLLIPNSRDRMQTVGEGIESWTGRVEQFEHSTEWERVIARRSTMASLLSNIVAQTTCLPTCSPKRWFVSSLPSLHSMLDFLSLEGVCYIFCCTNVIKFRTPTICCARCYFHTYVMFHKFVSPKVDRPDPDNSR